MLNGRRKDDQEAAGAKGRTGSLFAPSAEVARRVDETVRERLVSSFAWLAETYPCLDIEPQRLQVWRARPAEFGLYFDLASAIHHAPETADGAENRARAERLAERIARAGSGQTGRPALAITTLGPHHYDNVERDCLQRWFDLEPENSMALLPLQEDEFAEASAKLAKALSFLREAVPAYHGELEALTCEIIFAKPGPNARLAFGGASSFALWGALALNSEAHPQWWEYLPRLVHEYSHNLLFGLAADGELVLNDPSETYRSPLRETPRPLDGIYHACYVSAREVSAMEAILEALPRMGLDEASKLERYCRTVATRSREAYHDCRTVVEKHGHLTELGSQVLEDTAEAMRR